MRLSHILKPLQRPARYKIFWLCLTVVSSLAIVSGALLLAQNRATAPSGSRPNATTPADNAGVSSVKPSANQIDNYTAAPDLPRYIFIPNIKVDKIRVKGLGLTGSGQIAVPDNIYDAGWYNASAKPGAAGAMFIFGHISNWTANGVFHDLKKLRANDQIIIERGDGQKFTYKVVGFKTYPADKVDMSEVLSPIDANSPGLNLMTCAGKVKKGTNDFTERLVVFATLAR